ncbi:P-loop containing nucleoside triphosphate hydrolase protein [Chytriomyces sp. MP71]|nr:P-loop containing nucleoside triphosphate hydrolase protein [Chytriomyces sp. MP71]
MVGVISDYLTGRSKFSGFLDNGYVLAIAFFLLQLLSAFVTASMNSLVTITNIRVGAAVTNALYKKGLRLSFKARQEHPPAKINSYCASDVAAIKFFLTAFNRSWIMPIQVVISLVLTAQLLHAATAVSAAVFISLSFAGTFVMPKLIKFRKEYLAGQDKRTKILREFLYGVKVIKYHGLEEHMEGKIKAARNEQVVTMYSIAFWSSIFLLILIAQQGLTTPLTIIAYGALGNEMSPGVIFTAISLLSGLISISAQYQSILAGVSNGLVSYRRLTQFLLADEVEPDHIPRFKAAEKDPLSLALMLEEASFTWETKETDMDVFKLEGISLSVPRGSLVAIVGATGSGKSSLLSGIAGTMRKTSGQATVYGTVGYCPQEPWILSGTIEENVTLLDASLKDKCAAAVEACALAKDLNSFPSGLWTQIGEKGVNLSGGQKARVALARAIARNPDIYILDDPLSALDAHVGKEIFEGTINGPVMKNKTVFLATHLLHVLPKVDHVIVMESGKIVQNGAFGDLLADTKGRLFDIMKDYHLDDVTDQNEVEEKAVTKVVKKDGQDSDEKVVEEDRKTGRVTWSTYMSYFRACGTKYTGGMAVAAVIRCVIVVLSNLFLAFWTSNYLNLSSTQYLYIYSAFSILGPIISFLVIDLPINYLTVKAGSYFHDHALAGLMKSPMYFYDTQPIGRILNRMTSDMAQIDGPMSMYWGNFIANATGQFANLIVLWYTSWQFVPISIFLLIVAVFVFNFYRKTYRELKRLNAILQSPITAHLSETLNGISTIQAYKAHATFIEKQLIKTDQSNLATMLFTHAQYWFTLRMELIGSLVTLALSLFGVSGIMDSRFIALSLSLTMNWAGGISWMLWNFGELETSMVAVERLNHYSHELSSEASRFLPKDGQFSNWPRTGTIAINELELRYESRPDLAVINSISLNIKAGEKIGIVGRTGSGKSTLMDSFFRIIEASKGAILVDGEDISTFGLKKLRTSIQMIPQTPILLDGSVRSNIDSTEKYTDDEIWYALECCGMKEYVSGLSDKLESRITEGGSNLSAGQRQLLCLAKVLLEKGKILIMDEATSSVDAESDLRIQDSMTSHFKDATVLSVAHRLNTIAAFDRILVLDQGRVAEFDAPHVLLSREGSIFGEMVQATGAANAVVIADIAKSHFASSQSMRV